MYLYGLGHIQNIDEGKTFVEDSHYKEPRSNYMFYFESLVFDKMLAFIFPPFYMPSNHYLVLRDWLG